MSAITSLPAVLSPPLEGREAVADALYRCTLGFDTDDQSLFDSAFTQDATLEFNGRVSDGLSAIHKDCFDIISKKDTTHFITNIRINIADNGKEATLTASALAQHFRGGKGMEPDQPRLLTGSLYHLDLVKDAKGGLFKIKTAKMRSTWVEGEWGVVLEPEADVE